MELCVIFLAKVDDKIVALDVLGSYVLNLKDVSLSCLDLDSGLR